MSFEAHAEPWYDSLDAAISGLVFPEEIRDTLALVTVPYISFTGEKCHGQLVIYKECVDDIEAIFEKLVTMRFPIEKIVPIVAYGWSDEASMQDNNTSAFNYRVVAETGKVSNHALGTAIDINPLYNPQFGESGKVYPSTGTYDQSQKGTITAQNPIVSLFESKGWKWGGRWDISTDYQHFEKHI